MTSSSRLHLLALVATLCAANTGCATSRVAFTHELRVDNQLNSREIKGLQFYLSERVVLEAVTEKTGRHIDDGRLTLRRGRDVEKVVIDKDTPGVASRVGPQTIDISFGDASSLRFSLQTNQPDSPSPHAFVSGRGFATPPPSRQQPILIEDDSRSEPLADGTGSYWLDRRGLVVTFHGRQWEAVDGSLSAHLEIDTTELEDDNEKRTVLGGQRL